MMASASDTFAQLGLPLVHFGNIVSVVRAGLVMQKPVVSETVHEAKITLGVIVQAWPTPWLEARMCHEDTATK